MSGLLNKKVSRIFLLTQFGFPDVPIVTPSQICRSTRENRLPAHVEKTPPLWLRQTFRRDSSLSGARGVGKRKCAIKTQGPTRQLVATNFEGDKKRCSLNVAG
jgi:hypothetical protein